MDLCDCGSRKAVSGVCGCQSTYCSNCISVPNGSICSGCGEGLMKGAKYYVRAGDRRYEVEETLVVDEDGVSYPAIETYTPHV